MNRDDYSIGTKIRFYATVGGVYIVTVLGLWSIGQAGSLSPATPVAATPVIATKKVVSKPTFVLVSGKPIRIVIPDSGIDLPVIDGNYNESDGSWTLSPDRAQFAMISFLANNLSGNTFIYGHGTDQVFGSLGITPPASGAIAQIYTDNGHVLQYAFDAVRNLDPNDTSVLDYKGPSISTLQTCTGSLSEWRSMFQFHFVRVES